MKTILTALLFATLTTTYDQAAKYEIMENLECSLIETPTSAHDSWSVSIIGDKVGFFDNDSYAFGTRTRTYVDGGGSTIHEFKSDDAKDPWTVLISEPIRGNGPVYAELFLDNETRPNIFDCKEMSAEQVKTYKEQMAGQ